MSTYKRGGCDKTGPKGTCSKCGKKRGSCGAYWYKFMWHGELIRKSTGQGNDDVARDMEAAHRTSLAKGEVGIREKKAVPTLGAFAKSQFLPWAEATFSAKPKTWLWYRNGVRRILGYSGLADCSMDKIAGEHIGGYVARRQSEGLLVSSINRELQVLRRMLRLGVEWGVAERTAKVRMISGENHREFACSVCNHVGKSAHARGRGSVLGCRS